MNLWAEEPNDAFFLITFMSKRWQRPFTFCTTPPPAPPYPPQKSWRKTPDGTITTSLNICNYNLSRRQKALIVYFIVHIPRYLVGEWKKQIFFASWIKRMNIGIHIFTPLSWRRHKSCKPNLICACVEITLKTENYSKSSLTCSFIIISRKSLIYELLKKIPLNSRYFLITIPWIEKNI